MTSFLCLIAGYNGAVYIHAGKWDDWFQLGSFLAPFIVSLCHD